MKNKELIQEYESKSGKKAIVDGQETIGFKRWKQQHKSLFDIKDITSKFRKEFKKDVDEIIKIYLKEANITSSQKNILKYLNKYKSSVFPSRVTYKGKSYKITNGKLTIKGLGIKDLQNVKGLFKQYSLKRLDLSFNKLKILSKRIKNLKNLKYINLEQNNLSELPKGISNLTNLKSFNIGYNDLIEISKEFGNLTNLRVLNMYSNNIIKIPKEFGNLKNLIYINLSGNDISELPKEIGNLKDLEYINLENNDLSESNIPNTFLDNKNIEIYW